MNAVSHEGLSVLGYFVEQKAMQWQEVIGTGDGVEAAGIYLRRKFVFFCGPASCT
jgi:hypothetical protein